MKTEDTQNGEKVSGTVQRSSSSAIHDDNDVLHDGQDMEEEINVPAAGVAKNGVSKSGDGPTTVNISDTAENELDKDSRTGDVNAKSLGPAADEGTVDVTKPGLGREADRKSCYRFLSRSS